MGRIIPTYNTPWVTTQDGRKVIDLDTGPTLFFAVGDAPSAILSDEANELMTRTLEELDHPRAAHYREELGKPQGEELESGEARRWELYDALLEEMVTITPETHQFIDGGFAGGEGIWYGWMSKP